MKRTLGAILISAPFLAVFGIPAHTYGIKQVLLLLGAIAIISASVISGAYLLTD